MPVSERPIRTTQLKKYKNNIIDRAEYNLGFEETAVKATVLIMVMKGKYCK